MATKPKTDADAPLLTEAEAENLIKQRLKFDKQRLASNRAGANLAKKIIAIDDQLKPFILARKTGRMKTILFKAWRLTISKVPKGLYWKGVVEELLTTLQIQARIKKLGKKDVVVVEPVDG